MFSSSASWHESKLHSSVQHHRDMDLGGALTGLHLRANAISLCLPQLELKAELRNSKTRSSTCPGSDKSFWTGRESTGHLVRHDKNGRTAASDDARLASLEEDAAWALVALSNGRPRQYEEGALSAKRQKLAQERELVPSPHANGVVAQRLPGGEQRRRLIAAETAADVITTLPTPVSSPVASGDGLRDFDLNVMPPVAAETVADVIVMPPVPVSSPTASGGGLRDFGLNEMPMCEEMK